jgi:hypothetical protein
MASESAIDEETHMDRDITSPSHRKASSFDMAEVMESLA